MQIDDGRQPDPHARTVLHLYNDHNVHPKYLTKRSFVETIVSYRCRLDLLRPYDGTGIPWVLEAESFSLAVRRVMFMKVEQALEPRFAAFQLPPPKPNFFDVLGQQAESEESEQLTEPEDSGPPGQPQKQDKPVSSGPRGFLKQLGSDVVDILRLLKRRRRRRKKAKKLLEESARSREDVVERHPIMSREERRKQGNEREDFLIAKRPKPMFTSTLEAFDEEERLQVLQAHFGGSGTYL